MKIKCIKSSTYFDKGKIYAAEVDLIDLCYYDADSRDSAIVELYVSGITIASIMYRHYKKDKIKSWYFDYNFKTRFEIVE